MKITMIYSELTLLSALTELLQLFQNKDFGKGEKWLLRAISELSGQQKLKNKKEAKKVTSMEFLDLCFTGSVAFHCIYKYKRCVSVKRKKIPADTTVQLCFQ